MIKPISRRTVLRGLGGVTVGLPALELMSAESTSHALAAAASAPRRFFLGFFGTSLGADTFTDDLLQPTRVGANYDIRPATQPIADLGVQDEITLVSGLKIPWQTGATIPPGGREASTIHYQTYPCLVAGTHSKQTGDPKCTSCDLIVADAIAGNMPHKVLSYGVQQGASANLLSLTWRGSHGTGLVEPIVSPRVAYDALFAGFNPTGSEGQPIDPQQLERAKAALHERQTVLDLVRQSTQRLVARLGSADRHRMEQHFDQIRDLETRIDALDPAGQPAPARIGCIVPPEPPDLADERAISDAFNRLVAMAFACDQARVACVPLTESKSRMDVKRLVPSLSGELHSLTHHGRNQIGLAEANAWGIKQFASLVKLLRDTPDVGGTSLLDNSALVFTFEGGSGFDPSTGYPKSAHSTENMAVLVAGRAGGLRPGRHILGEERHPARVVLSAMHACGVKHARLGEVEGIIPELFV